LYALGLAAGDAIRITNQGGAFEIIQRGGKVAVQFYLADSESGDAQATTLVSERIAPELVALSGHNDAQTAWWALVSTDLVEEPPRGEN
jgi:hypothetical protein